MMTTIILIRHAPTQPDPSLVSDQWQLTDNSARLCKLLASRLKDYTITKIYTSYETKAQLTGKYIAEVISCSIEIADNLHETERKSKHFYESRQAFEGAVTAAMRQPDMCLFGDETFADAQMRLTAALGELANQHTGDTVAVVSHGRIMAMLLAQMMDESPVTIWQSLKMPAYTVIEWNNHTIEEVVYGIEDVT